MKKKSMKKKSENLLERVGKAHFSQKWIAEQVGVSQSMISRWIRGFAPIPEARKKSLAKALGCKIKDI